MLEPGKDLHLSPDGRRSVGKEKQHMIKESSELYQMMAGDKSSYSVDDRLQTVMLYVTEGNMKKVEKMTGIPYVTLASWKDKDWWGPALNFVHKRKDRELELRFSKVIHDTVSEIHDRVTKGDWVVQKDGTKSRKPMNGRDLAVVMGVIHDKRQLLRGEATSLTGTSQNHNDKLKQLEEKFNQFSSQLKAKTIEAEVVRE